MKWLRRIHELERDPDFSFRVGRLVGAAEVASHLMKLKEDPEVKELGIKLEAVSDWFFEHSD